MQDFVNEKFIGNSTTHRRAIYNGCGYCAHGLNKPHIGIANAFSEMSPGHAHLRELAQSVKEGVWQEGGIPFEFGIPSTCGTVAMGTDYLSYELALRDVVAGSIELVTKIQLFDGLIILASCDNIIAGAMVAAARLRMPVLIITGGPMMSGRKKDGGKIMLPDVDEMVFGRYAREGCPADLALAMEEDTCPTVGACPVMGTANTMQALSEAVGLTMPGTSTIPAYVSRKKVSCQLAGKRIVHMVKEGLTADKVLTSGMLHNGMKFSQAINGSTNAVMHLISMGKELGIDIALSEFDTISKETPAILNISPIGPYTVDELYDYGGVPQIMRQLESLLDTDVLLPTGKTLGEELARVPDAPNDFVRSISNPVSAEGGMAIMYGSLAPDGAVMRTTLKESITMDRKFVAHTFSSDEDAFKAIQAGEIHEGDAIILRYLGPSGAPGMVEVMQAADALVDFGLASKVAVITDGRFSGFNYGIIIGHVAPEASHGGNIALIHDGDLIEVNVPERKLNICVSDEELAERRKTLEPFEPRVKTGFMRLYDKYALPANLGAGMQDWD